MYENLVNKFNRTLSICNLTIKRLREEIEVANIRLFILCVAYLLTTTVCIAIIIRLYYLKGRKTYK